MGRREISIHPATPEHAAALAPNMRAEDVAEVLASDGFSPLEALLYSLGRSSWARAMLIDGEVAAMYGVAPVGSMRGLGLAWVLTGEAVNRAPFTFLRACRRELPRMAEICPVLVTAIDARYQKAVAWAKWLGAAIHEPIEVGPESRPFIPVHLGGG